MWLYLLFAMVSADFAGNLIAKEWSLHGGKLLAFSAIVMFIITNIFWLFAIKSGSGLGRGVMFFAVGTSVLAFLAAVIWYKEPISTAQIIGAFLGVLAIILLSVK